MKSGILVILALSVCGAFSCGSAQEGELGMEVSVASPSLQYFPDINAFENCDFVTVCSIIGSKKRCETVANTDKSAELSGVSYGKDAAISVECRPGVTSGSDVKPGKAVSSGRTCGSDLSSGDFVQKVLFMLPVNSMGPTIDAFGAPTNPNEARWGATLVTVDYVSDEQALKPGSVLIIGGASFKAGCTEEWSTDKCVGGVSKKVELYNPEDGSFTYLGEGSAQRLTTGRAFATTATLTDGRIAVFGGIGEDGNPTASVEIIDPTTGTIVPAPPMTKTRAWHTATLVGRSDGGYILLAGGKGSGIKTWEIWNPLEGMLGLLNMNAGRYRHTATLIKGIKDARDMVVLVGGEDGSKVLDNFEIFDLSLKTPNMDPKLYPLCSNDATTTAPLPKTMHAAVFVPDHKFLYIVGGFDNMGHNNPVNTVCVWSVTGEEFNMGAQKALKLGVPRGGLSGTLLDNNVVLFAGGLTRQAGNLVDSATAEVLFEFLDQNNKITVDLSNPVPMLEARWDQSAIATCDGRVTIVGGIKHKGTAIEAAGTAEVYNPDNPSL